MGGCWGWLGIFPRQTEPVSWYSCCLWLYALNSSFSNKTSLFPVELFLFFPLKASSHLSAKMVLGLTLQPEQALNLCSSSLSVPPGSSTCVYNTCCILWLKTRTELRITGEQEIKPAMKIRTYSPSKEETEAGGLWVCSRPELHGEILT